jgi:serine/threonine protein kinase
VYSYAMIFHYLLDGRPPWPTLNGIEAVRKASEEGDRPNIPRNWDERLISLLVEGWNENPNARPSFNRIIEELDAYVRKSWLVLQVLIVVSDLIAHLTLTCFLLLYCLPR